MITPSTTNISRYAPGMSRRVKGILVGLVHVLLLLGVLVAFMVLLNPLLALFGLQAVGVASGSMEPSIRVGDALLVRKLNDGSSIVAGDVITYRNVNIEGLITHRVKAVKEIQGVTYYQTQGDANATPDPDLTAAQSVYGKKVLTLPKVGYLFHFFTTPWALLLAVALLLILISTVLSSLVPGLKKTLGSRKGSAL